MEVSASLVRILAFVNEVFISIGEKPLLENSKFKHHELTCSDWLKVELNIPDRPVFNIVISIYGIEIQIDRVVEAFDWAIEDVLRDPDTYKETLRDILTCKIEIKYLGARITTISFIDNKGNRRRRIRDIEGIPVSFKKTVKNFDALFA